MTDEKEQPEAISKKPRGCLVRLLRIGLVGVVALIGTAVWFNGPGVRWLGPKVAERFLEKAGFEGELKISGSLFGGLDFSDIELRSEGLVANLKIDHLETDYVAGEIIKGKIRKLTGDGVHLDIHLLENEDESKPPINFQELSESLTALRKQVLPVGLDFKDVNVRVMKNGERLLELEDGALLHRSGEDRFVLDLGKVTDATGRSSLSQRTEIQWLEDGLRIDQFELLPGFGIRDLLVKLPKNGAVQVQGQIRLEDATFDLVTEAGLKQARLELVEGNLDLKKSMDGFGIKIPLTGKVDAFSMVVSDPFPNWRDGTLDANASLTDVSYADWHVSELGVDLDLDESGKLTAKLDGESLNTGFSVSATSEMASEAVGAFVFPSMEGDLKIERADDLLFALQQKLDWKINASRFPESELSGKWKLDLSDGFQSVAAELLLNAKDPDLVPIRLSANFSDQQLNVESFAAEGLDISGYFHFGHKTYEERTQFEGFRSEVMRPWSEGLGFEWPGSGVFNGGWIGTGDFTKNTHQGEMSDFSFEWKLPGRPLIAGRGELKYAWPSEILVNDWVFRSEGQQIELNATIRDSLLTLNAFKWLDGKDEIANGSGKVSLPKNLTELKSWISKDEGVLEFKLNSKVIALSKLKPWVAGMEQLAPSSTGELQIELSGGFAAPEVSANLQLRNIKSLERPSLPRAGVVVNLQTKDGLAKVEAEILVEDYPPASLVASMPFLPKKWVDQPGSIGEEKIAGKLLLPSLNLSRVQALIPQTNQVSGTLDGFAEISGTISSPEIVANLSLKNGRMRTKSPAIPDFEGVSFNLTSNHKQMKITGSVANLSGGNMNLDGVLDFDTKAGLNASELDLNIRARGLPLMRNEFLIMRSHVDLKVKGRLDTARVSGQVGIIDSIFYKDLEFIPIGKPFLEPTPAKLPAVEVAEKPGDKVPEAFMKWTADVLVKTVDPILIRGNLGEGEIDVAIRVGGELGDPIPNGTARLREALIRLPFTKVKVKQATLTFNKQTRFDPMIEIQANANPRPYQVDIYAYGRASDPQLVLVSQPPLPKEEIMTLLATGATSAGLENSQLAASRATQLLLEELRRGRFLFGKQLRPLFALLDDVDFSIADPDPYSSATFNTATLKLSNRWSVSAGVNEEGDQRMMATWRLSFK